jgi:hypothetical protein
LRVQGVNVDFLASDFLYQADVAQLVEQLIRNQ